jgi:hypothetical protein
MIDTLASGGVLTLLVAAAFVWGYARVLDAPPLVFRAIPFGVLAVMLAALVLLAPDHPFRLSVAGTAELLLVAGLIAGPVLGYRLVLRRLRARQMTAAAPVAARPLAGLVRISDDRALVAEVERMAGTAPRAFSLLDRTASGDIAAAARVSISAGLGTISHLHAAPGTDFGAILAATRSEAAAEGARQLAAAPADASQRRALLADGFRAEGAVLMIRDLP